MSLPDLFAARDFALLKAELSIEDLNQIFDESRYREHTKRNWGAVHESLLARSDLFDAGFIEDLSDRVTLSGSVRVPRGVWSNSTFFTDPHRLGRNGLVSRGYSYVIALDKGLTASEKLQVLRKDIAEGLAAAAVCGSKLERFIVSDFIKNALITMLNALVSEEKLGAFRLLDGDYQRYRKDLIDMAASAVAFHYQQMLVPAQFEPFSMDFEPRLEEATRYLESWAWRRYSRLQDASISRPEAAHPLILYYAALKIAFAFPDTDAIIGLPSGGTELALLTRQLFRVLYTKSPALILLPVSLHSVKSLSAFKTGSEDESDSFLGRHAGAYQSIVICDDNSSTGRTIQRAHQLVSRCVGANVNCAVAEADIRRSLIDKGAAHREYVANPRLFAHSVGVLPVSKSFRPKTDFKELLEQRTIVGHHYRQLNQPFISMTDRIYHEIMIEAVSERVSDAHADTVIPKVQGTCLSNFYALPVQFEGTTYPSVEHAYQRQKFTNEDLRSATIATFTEIGEAMRMRGYGASILSLEQLFLDDRFNAGNIKIVADILRHRGYGRKDWVNLRIRTMIQLLICKFSNEEMARRLLETGDRTIVEGNDWDDTLWGVCRGQGQNLLGRALMNIRAKLKKGMICGML